MRFIDFGKTLKKSRKKDPNIDAAELFAGLCQRIIEEKNAYHCSKALKQSELPKDLTKKVKEYFKKHRHQSYKTPFELQRLEKSNINEDYIYAVPKGVYEELEDDSEFERGLAEVGRELGILLKLPWYCFSK